MSKAEIQYGKIITTQNVIDWEMTPAKIEREVSLYSSRENLIKDLIGSLHPLNIGETKKLEICIKVIDDDKIHIVKKWPVKLL